jgi:hypothetical protein
MIKKVDKDIRNLSYQLSSIINTQDQTRILVPGITTFVDVIEGVPIHYKMACKGKPAPAKFNIKYATRGDLQVTFSYNNKQPNEFSNNGLFQNVNILFNIR